VDMLAGDVLSLAAEGTIDRRHVGNVAAVLRPRRQGGAVIGVERGFALEEADGTLTHLGELWSDTNVRMNEGSCDPDGRFYCGSMAYDERPGAGALYRLDPDSSVRVVLENVTISNGLEWSPDGSCAYYNYTPTQRIDVFDYEDSESGLTGRRPLAEIPAQTGGPDGLTVDEEGGVWVALYQGAAVQRYTPDGILDEVIGVAAKQVTACTFGGQDHNQLFIATTREGLEPGEDPLAGSLFPGSDGGAFRRWAANGPRYLHANQLACRRIRRGCRHLRSKLPSQVGEGTLHQPIAGMDKISKQGLFVSSYGRSSTGQTPHDG
jgi:sugar lactone lactonase YvrE